VSLANEALPCLLRGPIGRLPVANAKREERKAEYNRGGQEKVPFL